MNKLALIFIVFVGIFSFQVAYSCEDAFWDLGRINTSGQTATSSTREIFQRLYVDIKKSITPDVNIAELEILPETTSLVYNKYNKHRDNQFYKIAKWRGEKVLMENMNYLCCIF